MVYTVKQRITDKTAAILLVDDEVEVLEDEVVADCFNLLEPKIPIRHL